MLGVTIALYVQFPRPYLVDEGAGVTTIMTYYRTQWFWLLTPALACGFLAASVWFRLRWLCALSAGLACMSWLIIGFGPAMVEVLDAFTQRFIGTSGFAAGSGYFAMEKLGLAAVAISAARLIFAVVQQVLYWKTQPV